jgi:hypothetical protein
VGAGELRPDPGTAQPLNRFPVPAGLVAAVGSSVEGVSVGDVVTTHSLPLREQGSWAEKFIAAAAHVAVLPPGVPASGRRPTLSLAAPVAGSEFRDVGGGDRGVRPDERPGRQQHGRVHRERRQQRADSVDRRVGDQQHLAAELVGQRPGDERAGGGAQRCAGHPPLAR